MRGTILALAIVLAACSTSQSPSSKLLTIDQNFSKAATRVLNYDSLPRCPTAVPPCSDPAVVLTLKDDVNAGDAKLDAAWKSLTDADIGAASTAEQKLEADLSANKVQ